MLSMPAVMAKLVPVHIARACTQPHGGCVPTQHPVDPKALSVEKGKLDRRDASAKTCKIVSASE